MIGSGELCETGIDVTPRTSYGSKLLLILIKSLAFYNMYAMRYQLFKMGFITRIGLRASTMVAVFIIVSFPFYPLIKIDRELFNALSELLVSVCVSMLILSLFGLVSAIQKLPGMEKMEKMGKNGEIEIVNKAITVGDEKPFLKNLFGKLLEPCCGDSKCIPSRQPGQNYKSNNNFNKFKEADDSVLIRRRQPKKNGNLVETSLQIRGTNASMKTEEKSINAKNEICEALKNPVEKKVNTGYPDNVLLPFPEQETDFLDRKSSQLEVLLDITDYLPEIPYEKMLLNDDEKLSDKRKPPCKRRVSIDDGNVVVANLAKPKCQQTLKDAINQDPTDLMKFHDEEKWEGKKASNASPKLMTHLRTAKVKPTLKVQKTSDQLLEAELQRDLKLTKNTPKRKLFERKRWWKNLLKRKVEDEDKNSWVSDAVNGTIIVRPTAVERIDPNKRTLHPEIHDDLTEIGKLRESIKQERIRELLRDTSIMDNIELHVSPDTILNMK